MKFYAVLGNESPCEDTGSIVWVGEAKSVIEARWKFVEQCRESCGLSAHVWTEACADGDGPTIYRIFESDSPIKEI